MAGEAGRQEQRPRRGPKDETERASDEGAARGDTGQQQESRGGDERQRSRKHEDERFRSGNPLRVARKRSRAGIPVDEDGYRPGRQGFPPPEKRQTARAQPEQAPHHRERGEPTEGDPRLEARGIREAPGD